MLYLPPLPPPPRGAADSPLRALDAPLEAAGLAEGSDIADGIDVERLSPMLRPATV